MNKDETNDTLKKLGAGAGIFLVGGLAGYAALEPNTVEVPVEVEKIVEVEVLKEVPTLPENVVTLEVLQDELNKNKDFRHGALEAEAEVAVLDYINDDNDFLDDVQDFLNDNGFEVDDEDDIEIRSVSDIDSRVTDEDDGDVTVEGRVKVRFDDEITGDTKSKTLDFRIKVEERNDVDKVKLSL